MKTSVVMSTYNGERYIFEQLESLRKQTMKPDEVLIFDDGSSDSTVSLVSKYIQDNNLENWQITVNKHNKGWRQNFMDGMWQSTGDIVFPCDQDDVWLEDKIAKMTKLMKEHSEIQLLVTNYIKLFDDGKTSEGPWRANHELQKLPLKKNYMSVDAPGCVYCVRRKLLNTSKKYWRKEFGHDTLLWRMAELANTLYVIKEPTIKWRKHNDSSYAKEVLLLKTQAEKKKWLSASSEFNNLMYTFVSDYGLLSAKPVLDETNEWLSLRTQLYKTRNLIYGIKLIRYWSVYPRYRQLLGDWYLVLFNK